MDLNADMLRGHIDTIILLSLIDGDKDTNEIRRQIEEKSENKYSVKQGTFYSAMQRLTKQQFIKEYRSSSNDGIRRKYFSLTDKGKAFVENNRQEWQKSKELIDTLIDDDVKPQKQSPVILSDNDFPIPPVDDYFKAEEIKNNESEPTQNEVVEQPISYETQVEAVTTNESADYSVDEEIGSQSDSENAASDDEKTVKNDDNIVDYDTSVKQKKLEDKAYPFEIEDSELYIKDETDFEPTVEITVRHDDNIPIEKESQAQNESDGSEEIVGDTVDEFDESLSQIEQLPVDDVSEESVTVENIDTKADEPNNIRHVVETEESEEKITTETPAEKITEQRIDNRDNDLLNFESGVFSNRREYKSILSSLFPKENENEQPEEKNETIESTDNVNNYYSENLETVGYSDEYREPYRETYRESDRERVENRNFDEGIAVEKPEKVYSHSSSMDFSDLYSMANREGFKIKTSYNTNKLSSDKIMINKLNCHSSLLFFVVLFAEMLILNLCLDNVLNWASNVKLIILGVAAMFPLIMFFIYAIDHSRSVKSISSFKDVIEIALIIAFQLTIIVLCIALFASIDFSDFKSVTEYILLPFILILNIPLFFMMKYALLSTGKYFERKKVKSK